MATPRRRRGALITGEASRNIPRDRISVYECKLNMSGQPGRGKYVTGWYGGFTSEMLRIEIMPSLAILEAKGWLYPFLITSHRLKEKTKVYSPEKGEIRRGSDLDFDRREPESPKTDVAVVFSPTEFKLLSPR